MTLITLIKKVKSALNNKGQGLTEYVLILGLIALAVMASLTPLGRILEIKFTEFAAKISGA